MKRDRVKILLESLADASTLAKRFPGKIVAAGRCYHAARRLSVEGGGAILLLEVDVCSDAANEQIVWTQSVGRSF